MTYTLTTNSKTIIRDEDGAFIPADPANVDYQEYLRWSEAGNDPTPAMPPEPPKAEPPQVQVTSTKTRTTTKGK